MTPKQQQIVDAAEALAAEGATPTMENVRARMGGGSFSTISPVLRAWKAENQAKIVQSQEAPPEAIDAGAKAAGAIWSAAMATTEQRIEDVERLADVRVKTAEREADAALADIARLEAAIQDAQAETGKTAADLEAERQAHAETRARTATAEAQASEREKRIQAQIRELEQVNASLRASAVREKRLSVERDQAQAHAADLEEAVEDLRTDLAVTGADLAAAKAKVKASGEALSKADERVRGAEMRERSARHTAAELQGQVSVLDALVNPGMASDRKPRSRT